ncbi:DUF1810 domain-containing protein [Enterocloster aldenensis]|uniref:DUF1810 domain-containing protein n=1 Tax=Enterocloster aldenensis TaxID=358742 RepID=UPI000E490815|nr:DUF1810 domain-containing protein [Enterocloster aldenensis]
MQNFKQELERFLVAQENIYPYALSEMKDGHKRSHWIWFIFPQIHGLGHSEKARYFAISDIEEAKAYMAHPILSKRLIEISNALLSVHTNNAREVMGYPDDLKLKSCMTLFSIISVNPIFQQVLDKFFNGERDEQTILIINGFQ